MIEITEFRGAATGGDSVSKSEFVRRLCNLLPLRKLPPKSILNLYLKQGRVDRGMSGGMSWTPFTITQAEFEDLVAKLNISPIDAPSYIETELEWEAWCYHVEHGVPFEDFVEMANNVAELEAAWKKEINKKKSAAEDEIHLKYIAASNALESFIDRYTSDKQG